MSWSITVVGKPDRIAAALDKYSESLTGVCKKEFDEVLPGVKAILGSIKQGVLDAADPGKLFEFAGRGSGCVDYNTGEKLSATCEITLEPMNLNLV